MQITTKLKLRDKYSIVLLFGEDDSNLRKIEQKYDVEISSRGQNIAITGQEGAVYRAKRALLDLYEKILNGTENDADLQSSIEHSERKSQTANGLVIKTRRQSIISKNQAQENYLHMMERKDVCFAIGAAGTGKTYLAVAMAVKLFMEKKIDRIILSRPVREAGESLGFLPGDLKEKVDPYLRPLYDSLYDMMPSVDVERYFVTKEIEIAPLAYMRGRTLNRAFVILDEAQNTTPTQMKMFLTRLGHGSKMVITGDLTQIDLPPQAKSGLMDAIEKLKEIEEIGVVKFKSTDVVRHPITAKIIEAYE